MNLYCLKDLIIENTSSGWSDFGIAFAGALAGAMIAFILPVWWSKKEQNRNNKEELIKYFYNLHTALKNLSTCANNIEQVFKTFREKNELLAMPASNLDFSFNEEKLAFVRKFNPIFYESINILRIELKGLYELAILFKEEKKEFYIFNLRMRLIIALLQVMQTMKNVNDFLQIYGNLSSLISSQVLTNFNAAEDYIKNYVILLKESLKSITNDEEKEAIKKHLYDINNTPIEWSIKFHKKTWFEILGISKNVPQRSQIGENKNGK